MQLSRRHLLLGLATLAVAGCTSTRPALYRLQDPHLDVGAYHTFAFTPPPTEASASLLHRWLQEATLSQLERRGYAFDPGDPDLLVHIGGALEDRPADGHAAGTPFQTGDYTQGLLTIDLIDVQRRELVWQGVAKGRLGDEMLRDIGHAAQKAVAAIFEGFPLQSGVPPVKNAV